jgi:class 3 adenylate cyclase
LSGERVERRLAAVLAADVAGYSRLMGRDEERTLADLKRCRQTLLDPQIAAHRGRIVKTTGDGILVEFASVVEAVGCAVEVQRGMALQNTDVSHDLRIEFRIGIHVGDIIIDDNDIFGDGVNIAARLEGIAEPGGVCISRQVYDQIEGKLPLTCRPLGPQKLKNISKAVEAYAVDADGAAAGPVEPENMKLKVNYCRANDGVRLAYAAVGSGPPLVKTANWIGKARTFTISIPRSRETSRCYATMRAAMACPIGTWITFRWMPGSTTSRPWSTPPGWIVFPCSACRRDAPHPWPSLYGIRSA